MMMGKENLRLPCSRNCLHSHSLNVLNSFIEFGPRDNPKRGRIIEYIQRSRFIVLALNGEKISFSLKSFFDFVAPSHEEQDKLDKDKNNNNNNNNKGYRY